MFIPDFSKIIMCEFRYGYIKNKYGNKLKLLLTDTDSLMLEIKTEDIYETLTVIKKCFILVIIRLSQNIIMIQTN